LPKPSAAFLVLPRLRVKHGAEIALGPGKVDLLDAIERTGTLSSAAEEMGMSYMRAWKLVRTMNACFREPLVETARGGAERGRATLTEAGRTARDLYRRMEEACGQAMSPLAAELAALLAE
jgi:molybdate transport system regulatory protein